MFHAAASEAACGPAVPHTASDPVPDALVVACTFETAVVAGAADALGAGAAAVVVTAGRLTVGRSGGGGGRRTSTGSHGSEMHPPSWPQVPRSVITQSHQL